MKHNYDSGSTSAPLQRKDFASDKAYKLYLVKISLNLVEEQEKLFMSKFGDNNRLCKGDMASAGYEALLSAAHAFDSASGLSFEPYARKAIQNAMCAELRKLFPVDLKTNWEKDNFVYGETFDRTALEGNLKPWCCNWDDDERYLRELLTDAIACLTNAERALIEARYGINGEEMKLAELGNMLNVSHQAVDKKLRRILLRLRDFISNGYYPYHCCA